MAFGFTQFHKGLHDLVKQAFSKNILIFAAPTNEGNAGEINYPAKHGAYVFCMFSTTVGVRSSTLNPTESPASKSFAILGEDIKTCRDETESGTSFSTAIAAGLAGRLMDFARYPDCKEMIEHQDLMESKNGMSKVFEAMEMKDGAFRCLKPWKLLPDSLNKEIPFPGVCTKGEKTAARAEICQKICERLKEI